jgi:cation diffusion facilitator family transporter
MHLSLGIGLLMFVMKVGAYGLTGSAAILSDAAESVVHVAAVGFAAYSLHFSHKPSDSRHLYGHAKISYFSAGFEGAMIILAAFYILYAAIEKIRHGAALTNVGWGTGLTAAAAGINAALGAYLLHTGRKRGSVILRANGWHVLTDCWTSLGALAGVGLALGTGWLLWDPICAIALALVILVSGARLITTSFEGLMDVADPAVQEQLTRLLDVETAKRGVIYHDLRHRSAGDAYWIDFHLLFPDGTSLKEAHRTATEIERILEEEVKPAAHVTTHLEPLADHSIVHPEEGHR